MRGGLGVENEREKNINLENKVLIENKSNILCAVNFPVY